MVSTLPQDQITICKLQQIRLRQLLYFKTFCNTQQYIFLLLFPQYGQPMTVPKQRNKIIVGAANNYFFLCQSTRFRDVYNVFLMTFKTNPLFVAKPPRNHGYLKGISEFQTPIQLTLWLFSGFTNTVRRKYFWSRMTYKQKQGVFWSKVNHRIRKQVDKLYTEIRSTLIL